MDGRFFLTALATAMTTVLAVSAHAITHTSDYKTNMGNYRTCTDPLLETCDFPEVLSPSKYYLPNNTTTTAIHKDDGTVQLRIDAGGILSDANVTYPCEGELFECTSGHCSTTSPDSGKGCTINRCYGGTNHGGPCGTASACPGGTCTASDACVWNLCQSGPRVDKKCGGVEPACTSVADSVGWTVVFRGNQGSAYYTSQWHARVLGDGANGLMKVCDFELNGSGAVNESDLDCIGSDPESIHHVEILDPDGEIVAIPTIGPALLPFDTWTVEGDPARVGDCSRPSNAGFCP